MPDEDNLGEANRLRDEGLARMQQQEENREFVRQCKAFAREYARVHGQVTAQDVRLHSGIPLPTGGNPSLYGAVFRGKDLGLVPVNASKNHIPSTHGHMIRVWALADEADAPVPV